MGETRDWLKFFEQAKIPRSAAAQYAVTFIENRISMEMLMDLNKEYLRDMGIVKLGDIISILKHAKIVSQKLSADRALCVKPEEDECKVATKAASSSPKSFVKKPIAPPKPSETSASSISAKKKPTVSARLGPPLARKFSDTNNTNQNIFERLGNSEDSSGPNDIKPNVVSLASTKVVEKTSVGLPKPVKSAFNRLESRCVKRVSVSFGKEHQKTLLHNRIASREETEKLSTREDKSIISPSKHTKTTVSATNSSFNPQNNSHGVLAKSDEWEKVPVRKRLGDLKPVPAKGPTYSSEDQQEKSKKVKYVMVQTLKDGSQIKKTLDPRDPLLKRIPVKKIKKKLRVSREDESSVTSQGRVYENFIVNRRSFRDEGERTPIHQRIGSYTKTSEATHSPPREPTSRRKRISPPREEDRYLNGWPNKRHSFNSRISH